MAKFFGKIGYVMSRNTAPGVWEEDDVIEREYRGDILRRSIRYQTSDKVNDDINISNEISVVADDFADKNLHAMKYVVLKGTKWKISSIELQYPRLILSIGGVYNG